MGLNKPIRLLLTLLLVAAACPAYAQIQVSGHVYDSFGEPLSGASVMIKGTDYMAFSGGSLLESPPSNAEDTSSSPGSRGSHMPWSMTAF